jgi:hypothetical protein
LVNFTIGSHPISDVFNSRSLPTEWVDLVGFKVEFVKFLVFAIKELRMVINKYSKSANLSCALGVAYLEDRISSWTFPYLRIQTSLGFWIAFGKLSRAARAASTFG